MTGLLSSSTHLDFTSIRKHFCVSVVTQAGLGLKAVKTPTVLELQACSTTPECSLPVLTSSVVPIMCEGHVSGVEPVRWDPSADHPGNGGRQRSRRRTSLSLLPVICQVDYVLVLIPNYMFW